jgi:hypothetical protein
MAGERLVLDVPAAREWAPDELRHAFFVVGQTLELTGVKNRPGATVVQVHDWDPETCKLTVELPQRHEVIGDFIYIPWSEGDAAKP